MRLNRAVPALLLVFCAALPAGAGPGKTPSARRELQAIYNQINAAAAQKDVDGVFNYDAPDYSTVDPKGHVFEGSYGRQELQDLMNAVDTVKGTTTIKSYTGTDTDATVVVKDHYVFLASNLATGRMIKLSGDDLSRDYWVKTEDGWRRKRTRILSGKNVFRKNF